MEMEEIGASDAVVVVEVLLTGTGDDDESTTGIKKVDFPSLRSEQTDFP